MSFLTRLLDRKTSDETIEGYRPNEVQQLLKGIKNLDSFQYYYYFPGSKYPTESEKTKNQPVDEVLTFLNQHFTDSLSLHTEIQHKIYKSGRHEIIFKGRDPKNEIIKLSVIEFKKSYNETNEPKG